MSVKVLYRTSATAIGGRDGIAATTDGSLVLKLATPRALGGGGAPGNNPEQLFAAGYAACFIGALKFVAAQGGRKVPAETTVTATVERAALRGRFRPRHRARDLAAWIAARGRGDSHRRGAPRVPLLERHPQQRAGAPSR